MKQLLFLFLLLISTLALAKPNVIVSIAPQKTFVQKIAKDMVHVTVMVAPGSSPHSYEPKPSQMMALSKADIYFSIGVEFEKVWLPKFQAQNKKLIVVDISANIVKRTIAKHHHDESHVTKGSHVTEEHQHTGLDPHTWVSPNNVAIMAQSIYENLVKISPQNATAYKKNLNAFLHEIQATDMEIKQILKNVPAHTKFMAFHPSWGYFADEYDLVQVAIEVEGKSPQPKEIIHVIQEAKEEQVKVIFTQPEFSDKSAQIIAKEAGVRVQKISPLNPEWSQNLINMAEAIAKQ